MASQSSFFLLWGEKKKALDKIINEDLKENNILYKLIIPSHLKQTFIIQLDSLGMNEMALFPGLDGIGQYISTIYQTYSLLGDSDIK